MLRFRSLASGSSGNATLIEAHDGLHPTRVLIDCGLGLRQLQAALAADGLSPTDLDGVFITHEHGDHIGCVTMLAARYRVPIWTSAGTAQSLKLPHDADAPVHHVGDGQVFAIRGLEFRPFTVPHDAREPLQLCCTDGNRAWGQVLLTNFRNPNGLVSVGGNQWQWTPEAGAVDGAGAPPGTGTLGVLQSAAIEESNVDLTSELVNMITQQRAYQANAQSIKTQDQILQTLVNLR